MRSYNKKATLPGHKVEHYLRLWFIQLNSQTKTRVMKRKYFAEFLYGFMPIALI